MKDCSKRDHNFPSLLVLKKHLKEQHNREICDVCRVNSAATLSEQKLFTPGGFKNHMNHGDFDEAGNLVLYHPYCSVGEQLT